jgi:hypothetical protein
MLRRSLKFRGESVCMFSSDYYKQLNVNLLPHSLGEFVHQASPYPPGFSGGRGCSWSS